MRASRRHRVDVLNVLEIGVRDQFHRRWLRDVLITSCCQLSARLHSSHGAGCRVYARFACAHAAFFASADVYNVFGIHRLRRAVDRRSACLAARSLARSVRLTRTAHSPSPYHGPHRSRLDLIPGR